MTQTAVALWVFLTSSTNAIKSVRSWTFLMDIWDTSRLEKYLILSRHYVAKKRQKSVTIGNKSQLKILLNNEAFLLAKVFSSCIVVFLSQ
jgi:Na+/melibiose symporter-like transporter